MTVYHHCLELWGLFHNVFKCAVIRFIESYCVNNSMRITTPKESTCLGLVPGCHSIIPMPRERPQYGIPIPMTDERASQVSHCSWRTKASHNKSWLIPGPWAPPPNKEDKALSSPHKGKLLQPRASRCYIVNQTSSIEERGWAVFLHLIWGKSKVFSLTLSYLLLKHFLSHSLSFFFLITSTCSCLSSYRLVFHLHGQGMEW